MNLIKVTTLALIISLLNACVEAPPPPPPEPVPAKTMPTNVQIVDENGGSANVGDTLTGSFDYSYAINDNPETVNSVYRWLRNGDAIADATSASYTITALDNGQSLSFEVTPVLTSGLLPENKGISEELAINSVPSAIGVQILDINGGAVVEGDKLTGKYIYTDPEENPENKDQTTFAWFRDSEKISGAYSTDYIVTAADIDKQISFEVTPVALEGSSQGLPIQSNGMLAKPKAQNNAAPIASNVMLSDDNNGDLMIGDTLTLSYDYSDAENDAQDETTTKIQWLKNGVVFDHSGTSYLVTDDDAGYEISASVTPAALTGIKTGVATLSNKMLVTTALPNSAPVVSNVTVSDMDSGTTIVGHTLVASYQYSDSENDPENTSGTMVQWLRSGAIISGATNLQYKLTAADSSHYISVKITPAAQTGVTMGASVSAEIGINVVNSLPVANNLVITASDDSIRVGTVLEANYSFSDLDNDAEDKTKTVIQWYRNGEAISGASSNATTVASYKLTAADSEKDISFKVTPATSTTFGATVSSQAVHIDNSAPVATSVTINVFGDYQPDVYRQLRATYVYEDADNDLQDVASTTQQWLRDGVAIPGATTYYYNLTNADAGYDITYQVMPVATSGTLIGNTFTSNTITATNKAPVAVDDEAAVAQNSSVLVNVIANDNEPENQALSVEISTTGEHGTASVVDGKVQYVPEADFFGTDTVIYQIKDPFAQTSTAVLTVYVRPVVISLAQVLESDVLRPSFVTLVEGSATFPLGSGNLAVGQFNDDPYEDLIVSNPDYDRVSGEETLNNTGAVAVVFGNTTGNTVSLGDIEARSTTRGTLYFGDNPEDNFGAEISTIQTNLNSPYKSIAVSAPHHDSLGKSNNGSVYVIKPEHISKENYTMAALMARNSQRVYELRGEDDNEMLGSGLSSFEYYSGSTQKHSLALTSQEGLYLLDSNHFENVTSILELGNTSIDQPGGHFSSVWTLEGIYARNGAGTRLFNLYYSATPQGMNQTVSSNGSISNCGTERFAAMPPLLFTSNSSSTGASLRALAVLMSNKIILPNNYADGCNKSGAIVLTSDQSLTYAKFGAVGDINNDGFIDFVVTIPNDTNTTLVASGRAYVIFGGLTFNSFKLETLATGDGTKGFVIEGATAGELFGSSLSHGLNFDGDSHTNFVLGAPSANDGNGRLYVIHGNDAFGKVIP